MECSMKRSTECSIAPGLALEHARKVGSALALAEPARVPPRDERVDQPIDVRLHAMDDAVESAELVGSHAPSDG